LLYDQARVGPLDLVSTPPYDVISSEEQRRYLAASPYNIIRLVLGEDRPGDDEVDGKYRRAAAEFRRWREEGILVPTDGPRYFPYEMRFTFHGRPRRTRGLICLVDLEDWGGSILPHERTMEGPVADRLRLMRAMRANLSCIHAVFRGPCEPLAALLDAALQGPPTAHTVDGSGVEHRLWSASPETDVADWLAGESLMIADGHHRYTMALRYRDEMRAANGPGPWDRVMMLVVDASVEEPPVLPYHRLLVAGDPPSHGSRVRDLAEILGSVTDDELVYGIVSREDDELVHRVARRAGEPPTVCALHEQVLTGPEDALRFTHDATEAEDAVRRGRAVGAYVLPATNASRIRAVIDRGERLPQKSTFFWPKPRTGMVIRPVD
jgi:uncharacterized protein (DUF1015 family)